MPYTLWSRDRLLGKTDLSFRSLHPKFRAGEFTPTEVGERILPIFASLRPALSALRDVTDDVLVANPDACDADDWPPRSVRNTTAYADAMSLADELDSLALELRDDDGAVVHTDDIAIHDTEQLLALAEEDDALALEDDDLMAGMIDDEDLTAEMKEAIEEEVAMMTEAFGDVDDEPWMPAKEFARYQIFIALRGHDAAMSGDGDPPSRP